MIVDGGKISLKRPRVRSSDGEVPLEVLAKLRDQDLLDDQMREAMIDGLSSRNYSKVIKGFSERTGISKSSVSRAFLRASQKDLDQVNHAELSGYRFVGVMVDGSDYAGRAIIGAIGITDQCEKIPLGIREGGTENAEVVKDLLSSIVERKFTFTGDRIIAVIDGGKALKKALLDLCENPHIHWLGHKYR
jgi:transposase-like protein